MKAARYREHMMHTGFCQQRALGLAMKVDLSVGTRELWDKERSDWLLLRWV